MFRLCPKYPIPRRRLLLENETPATQALILRIELRWYAGVLIHYDRIVMLF